MAPILRWSFVTTEAFSKICKSGKRKAKVFPLPVTASTTTSLWLKSKGIAAAWTGVAFSNPNSFTMFILNKKLNCYSFCSNNKMSFLRFSRQGRFKFSPNSAHDFQGCLRQTDVIIIWLRNQPHTFKNKNQPFLYTRMSLFLLFYFNLL